MTFMMSLFNESFLSNQLYFYSTCLSKKGFIRKSKDYVYGIWVYKALDIRKGYYRVKKITGFVRETVNRGKK